MEDISIENLDQKLMISDNDTEAALLSYLWYVVQKVPVEDYLKDADKDENVSSTLDYLRLYCFVPFFIRASDIVWDYDTDRIYSFIDYIKEKVLDDNIIKPYTLNVIKNCLQEQGLIELSDFDISAEEDEDFYNHEKWDFFKQISYRFEVRDYLKSVGLNALTMLFSNITNSEDTQNLANSIYSTKNEPEASSSESSSSEDNCSQSRKEFYASLSGEETDPFDAEPDELDEYDEFELSHQDFARDEDSYDTDEEEDEEYEHKFASMDDFIEFIIQHADELIPLAPTFTQCHLYEFIKGDSD